MKRPFKRILRLVRRLYWHVRKPLSYFWVRDCFLWRGRMLTGRYAHWCYEWDGLPVDETCGGEWSCCHCFLGEADGQ